MGKERGVNDKEILAKAGFNYRVVENSENDLDFDQRHATPITLRHLKSRELKKMLFQGIVRIVKGKVKFKFKGIECKVDNDKFIIYEQEDGKTFKKFFESEKIIELKKSKGGDDKMEGEEKKMVEEVKEEEKAEEEKEEEKVEEVKEE